MDGSAFRVRGDTCTRVTTEISALKLHKNEDGGYAYDDALIFEKQIERVFERQYYESSSDGMKGLLAKAPNDLNAILSTKLVSRSSVLKESKATAARESTSTNTVAPEITSNNDAQDEADRINMFRLAAIGAKEGAAAGISKVVGTDITDATLRTTDGQDFKTVDEYTLYALMRAVIEGAERPATIDVRKLYVSLCSTKFDFRIKMVVNVERLRSQAAKSKGYGVKVGEDVIVLIIIANIEWAASQEWGGEFRDAMRSIRREFTYNKVHDAASCFDIMKFLAAADEARDLRKAKSPSGMANAVEEGLSYLGALVDSQHGEQSTYGEAYATTSDSESSAEKSTKSAYRRTKRTSRPSRPRSPSRSPSPPPRRRRDRGTSKRRSKKTDAEDQPKNDCRHCKKFGRIKPHPYVSEASCNWNKKSKSWRPEWVCKKMDVDYVKRSKFSSANGGYPSSSDDSDG